MNNVNVRFLQDIKRALGCSICTSYHHKMHTVDTNCCEKNIFKPLFQKDCFLSYCLIMYTHFYSCPSWEHHWYDIYLIKAHFPLLLFQLLSHVQLFCDPMNCSPPGSSVHGIFQARILKWVAISFPRESSQPRNQPLRVSCMQILQADSLPLSYQGSPIIYLK